MKLVIDIPSGAYESIKFGKFNQVLTNKAWESVRNSTPLTDCTDAISRSAVIEMIYKSHYGNMEEYVAEVKSLPSVNPTRKKRMDEQTIKDIDRAFKALEERDELLDKIRAEIKELNQHKAKFVTSDGKSCIATDDVLAIIDKYSKGGDSNA